MVLNIIGLHVTEDGVQVLTVIVIVVVAAAGLRQTNADDDAMTFTRIRVKTRASINSKAVRKLRRKLNDDIVIVHRTVYKMKKYAHVLRKRKNGIYQNILNVS